jgi:hypothetical protein
MVRLGSLHIQIYSFIGISIQNYIYITNLTFHNLIMKLCKICSFIIHTFHTLILCIENKFDTQIYRKMQNSCDICSFIGSYFIYQHFYPCVKCVSNTWYSCVKCTSLWTNKLHTIFIINSLHVRFMM